MNIKILKVYFFQIRNQTAMEAVSFHAHSIKGASVLLDRLNAITTVELKAFINIELDRLFVTPEKPRDSAMTVN
jgi:hypothetical protein